MTLSGSREIAGLPGTPSTLRIAIRIRLEAHLGSGTSNSVILLMVRRSSPGETSPVPVNPWLGVELRHLAALDAIARTGSFRGAADDLGYVQSAVSQQVARLEALVGVRLVDRERGTGPVELTEAGAALRRHSTAIVERLQAAQADIAAVADGLGGTVRVGVHELVACSLMPSILRTCRGRVRVVPTDLVEETEAFKLVAGGVLDVAFGQLPVQAGPFSWIELCADSAALVVHAGSPLAAEPDSVSLAGVVAQPLIRHERWRAMGRVEAELRAAGHEPTFVLSAGTSTAAQALVAEGLGAALLPRLALDHLNPGTVRIDLSDRLPRSTIIAFWHQDRELTPSLTEFLRAARTAARRASPISGDAPGGARVSLAA